MPRTDAVTDEADCRKKYIARCLFSKIPRDFSKRHRGGPFPLLCDDLRPSNVIVDADMKVRGVIDWEYCYAGPMEFSHCSPWWLLLARPETWEPNIDNFLVHYTPRQKLFLEVLQECENEFTRRGIQLDSPRVSEQMVRSLEDGTFWFHIAATCSFSFDDIYWRFIHPKHYKGRDSVDDLRKLLSEDEQRGMEPFVRKKMEQSKEGRLDTHRMLEEMM